MDKEVQNFQFIFIGQQYNENNLEACEHKFIGCFYPLASS